MEAIRVRRCRLLWSRPTPAGNGVVRPEADGPRPVVAGLTARGESRAGAKNGDCHQFAPSWPWKKST